ncbi:MAG: peptidylprolyl isomerase [Erythrobacter sp.]|uniref:esterase-like activity of phytase family protein n=1 Tax=Erythrobacter sp. TaxID=1042 RepID=UPI002623AEA9|nr:esterase-like activity of phytase family protein [Erythrobacter sp.]MDJ0977904.1 peptidylprolyl isomerase [Erythrobacter sp.]
MTWMRALIALTGLTLSASLAAQEFEDILPQTLPVPLDESDPERIEVGELIYRGGLRIEPEIEGGEEEIGGISGLEWVDDEAAPGGGALWAVSDNGRWMRIVPDESNGVLRDIYGMDIGTLRDLDGDKLKGKSDGDAEAIAFLPTIGWWVSFEQDHRIWQYSDIAASAEWPTSAPQEMPLIFMPADLLPSNNGIEALAAHGQGMIACAEFADAQKNNCVRVDETGEALGFQLLAPPALAEHGGAPTDAACAQDGTCYVLIRSFKPGYGNRAALIELAPDNAQKTLAVFDAPLTLDNFEGLALREQFGKRYLYLASDDNFNNCFETGSANCQHNLLLKFEIKSDEPPPAQVADAPEPDPQFETVDVVLETQMGDITIALEVERAPITAANFLRYVEEGRFDGTVFYRAMSLDREPKPNGLLQGGTQFDPKRILPGIEHEPTTKTGLSHTNGALSMAMLEPGSANGDFSIMLQDQTGLDARPEDPDPVWQNGYAVFGYVIEGMDVVAAIHGSPTDPDKGEGAMRGQMLAEPVTIIKARRIVAD